MTVTAVRRFWIESVNRSMRFSTRHMNQRLTKIGKPNSRNRAAPQQWVPDVKHCVWWAGRADEAPPALPEGRRWVRTAAAPMVDAAKSPALTRALYIPGVSHRRNTYVDFVLLKQSKA